MTTFADIANPWVRNLEVYEPGRPIEEVARELGFAGAEEIVKLASNENALGPSPRALRAMRSAARRMHRYPDGGAYALKESLARKLGVKPAQILAGNGSNEILELLAHVFLGPGTEVVVADGAFVVYRLVAAMSRADVVSVPMKAFTHDLDAMAAAVTPRTRIVFVANPNNPTSTMVGAEEIERFVGRVPDSVVVCFDEAYMELVPPAKQPDTLRYVREGRRVAVARTFSKTYGLAGLRLGYAVAPEECIALLERARQPFNANAMAQAAALAALEDDAFLERTRRMVARGLKRLQEEFGRMGLPYVPASANFVLVDVSRIAEALPAPPGGTTAEAGRRVFEALLRKGVIVRPVDCYGLPRYLRITVGTRAENETCIRALRELMGGA